MLAPGTREPARQAGAGRSAAAYDLGADEQFGGHTLQRHVGQTDAALRERLEREPGISAASTYTDRDTAERVVAATVERGRRRLQAWTRREGLRPNLVLTYRNPGGSSIGRSLARGARESIRCTDARVVIRWQERAGRWIVLTSYPEAS